MQASSCIKKLGFLVLASFSSMSDNQDNPFDPTKTPDPKEAAKFKFFSRNRNASETSVGRIGNFTVRKKLLQEARKVAPMYTTPAQPIRGAQVVQQFDMATLTAARANMRSQHQGRLEACQPKLNKKHEKLQEGIDKGIMEKREAFGAYIKGSQAIVAWEKELDNQAEASFQYILENHVAIATPAPSVANSPATSQSSSPVASLLSSGALDPSSKDLFGNRTSMGMLRKS